MLRLFGWLAAGTVGAIWWGHMPAQDVELVMAETSQPRSQILDRSAFSPAQLPIIQASFAASAPAPVVAPRAIKTSAHTQEQPTVPYSKVTWTTDTKPKLEKVVSNDAPGGHSASNNAPLSDAMVAITGTRVNLRSGPSTNDTVVGQLTKNMQVEVLGAPSNGWIELHHAETGMTGYMAARFTTFDG